MKKTSTVVQTEFPRPKSCKVPSAIKHLPTVNNQNANSELTNITPAIANLQTLKPPNPTAPIAPTKQNIAPINNTAASAHSSQETQTLQPTFAPSVNPQIKELPPVPTETCR